MVRKMMVIVEEDPLHDAVHAQIGSPFDDVAPSPCVIGVLQRAPVERKGNVAEAPAQQGEIERDDEQRLKRHGEHDLCAHAPTRYAREIDHHRLEAVPAADPVHENATAEKRPEQQVERAAQRGGQPEKTRQETIQPKERLVARHAGLIVPDRSSQSVRLRR